MIRGLVTLVLALALALAGSHAVAQPTIKEVPENAPRPRAPDPRDHGPETTDRRALYVGGGLLVLAMAFLWNRRRRGELEREIEDETRRNREQSRAARGVEPVDVGAAVARGDAPDPVTPDDARLPDDDDDAADLRAAARRSDEEPT